jgi:predicted metal-dependent hydrolase
MAYKEYLLTGDRSLKIFKLKKSRHMRITLSNDGSIRVSIPNWVTYAQGYAFALSNEQWIETKIMPTQLLEEGAQIGKAHRLQFLLDDTLLKPSARIEGSLIKVRYPSSLSIDSQPVQAAAQKAAIRALRKQAESLLPQRTKQIATSYGLSYLDVSIKQLKGRWGSCDQKQHIIFNLFLLQLPWEYIDYVIKHELSHTQFLNHGEDFWNLLTTMEPHARKLRTDIKKYRPAVVGQ